MARDIKFYGKKRGDRRTGSRQMGRAGMGLFFGTFLLIGLGSLLLILFTLSIPEWRANHGYVETQGVVLDSRIAEQKSDDGLTYRPEFKLEYTAGGAAITKWGPSEVTGAYSSNRSRSERILGQFPVGQKFPCWYDPRDPNTVVLERGYSWFAWLMLILPAAFLTIGGGGLLLSVLRWGKSTERISAMSQQSTTRDLFDPPAAAGPKFPNVPDAADLTNSAGTTLAYRLPSASARWGLLAMLLFCLFWNGIVSVFVTLAVRGHLRGEADWFLTLFMIPFVLVGIGAVGFLVRQVLIEAGVGSTIVEIEAHPLAPGGDYDVFFSQAGRLTITSLSVLLVCEETATYRQGTNTRTANRRVSEEQVFLREGFDIQQGLPFETRLRITIPLRAMHSFTSDHNKVEWKLVVKGAVARWPDFERGFPIVIRPDSAASEAA